jgi:hypothetical protein
MGPAGDSLPPGAPAQKKDARGDGVALEISADATIPSMSSPTRKLSAAPKMRLLPLKLHKIRRKELSDDIYASSERKTHWEDSIRRLHLIQMEERHSVNHLAVTTLRDKRAEWVGAPVNEEGSLDSLLEGDTGNAGAAAAQTTRANQRAMDALITTRGASMPRLMQAGKNPSRWMSKIQVS